MDSVSYSAGKSRGSDVAGDRSLGTIARNSTRALGRQITTAVLRRFFLQSAARDLLSRERVCFCLRRPIPQKDVDMGVDVLYSPCAQVGHYGGLQVCGSVWLCPVCSTKISERRRVEMSQALEVFYGEAGVRRVLLVTFTLSHYKSDNLSFVLSRLKLARKALVSGRWASNFSEQHNIVGYVRSLEVTYGTNGWHPHLHVLYFFDKEVSIISFEDAIKSRWSEVLSKVGGFASWSYGVDVRYSDKEVAKYIAKFNKEPEWLNNGSVMGENTWSVSHEMTKSNVKLGKYGGMTPLQMLYEYAYYRDEVAGRLWLQYATNFKGERQLFWSQGLKKRLGVVVDKTDQELASEQEEYAIRLATLTLEQWYTVLGNDARGDLLQVASTGDSDKVWDFLYSLGVSRGDLAPDLCYYDEGG